MHLHSAAAVARVSPASHPQCILVATHPPLALISVHQVPPTIFADRCASHALGPRSCRCRIVPLPMQLPLQRASRTGGPTEAQQTPARQSQTMCSNGIDVDDNPAEQIACCSSLAILGTNTEPRAQSTTAKDAVLQKPASATHARPDDTVQVSVHVGCGVAQPQRVHAAAGFLTDVRVAD